MLRRLVTLLLCLVVSHTLVGQALQQPSLQTVLDTIESNISLTKDGSPFHAEMAISGLKKEPLYEASITVDWASNTRYRVEVHSAGFHQTQIVNADQVQEQTEGDFYPGWLHSFVTALLDPLSLKPLLVDQKASIRSSQSSGNGTSKLCIDRNDGLNGIRDDMTWSGVCVTQDGLLLHTHTFVSWMDFSNHREFGEKQVARSYSTTAGSYEEIGGYLTSLRPLQTAEIDAIAVTQATPADKRIGFAFISTKAEETRLDTVKAADWPTVREGKTDGYMIVRALTDITGQVRETSKYNSDNPGLEEAGRRIALGYKFKPMLVDGVPVEMEMPLVLHFSAKTADPLPVLTGAEMLKQIKGCNAKLVSDFKIDASVTPTHISVNEQGKLTGEGYKPPIDVGSPAVLVSQPLLSCQFDPLIRNGLVTYYHGNLLVRK